MRLAVRQGEKTEESITSEAGSLLMPGRVARKYVERVHFVSLAAVGT
jgi:hypothetical protein